jgi:nitroreductase
MNPVIENIKARRSVRVFEQKKIDNEILKTIIDSARWAPSGSNTQEWRFVVIQDKSFRKKLKDLTLPIYKEWLSKMPQTLKDIRKDIDIKIPDPIYYNAPCIVFVIGKGMTADFDCSMACQNIMLSARSFGIGSCWVYIGQLAINNEEVTKALELSNGEKVFGPIVLGYPKGDFPEAPVKKDLVVKWI